MSGKDGCFQAVVMVRALVLEKKWAVSAEYSLFIAGAVLTRIQRIALGRSRGNRFSQFHEEGCCLGPSEAGIGNGDTMLKGDPFFPGLLAGVEIAFEHQPHDCVAAFAELPQYFVSDHALAGVVFLGVVMGAIDHDGTGDAFAGDRSLSFGDLFRLVVCFSASAAEHDMAVWIPHGLDDGGLAVGIDTDKMVRSARRNHGIHGDLQATFSPVLEADRHGDAACHLAMGLAFGRTRADRGPTDEIGYVLRTDRVQ